MTATDYITDTAAQLTEWGIDYRETTEGLSVGNIHLEVAEDGYRPAGTILNGTETIAITSDVDKAAAQPTWLPDSLRRGGPPSTPRRGLSSAAVGRLYVHCAYYPELYTPTTSSTRS